jgi:putative inorganic carbon (HCO3(-)) transporter
MRPRPDWPVEIGGHLVALLLPLAFNPFGSSPFEPVKVVLFQAITAGMLLAVGTSLLRNGSLRSWETGIRSRFAEQAAKNPLQLPVLLYAGLYVLASLISINPSVSVWGLSTGRGAITVLCLVLFFLLLANTIQSGAQVDRLITTLLVGSVPIAIYGWVQFLKLDRMPWLAPSLSAVHSTVGYSLFLGAYLSMVIPFTISRIVGGEESGRKRPLSYMVILFLQITCLLFTLSRGAWLGLLSGCLLLISLLANFWNRRYTIVFSLMVLIMGTAIFFSMNKGFVLPPPRTSNGLSDNASVVEARAISNNERITLWIYTLPMISRRFLLGFGPETYSSAFLQSYPAEHFPEVTGLHPWDPHNIILYHLTAVGLLGFLAFIWVLVRFYKITFAAVKMGANRHIGVLAAAILSSATAYLVQSQFNPNSIVSTALFWLILAMGLSLFQQEVRIMTTQSRFDKGQENNHP